MSEKELLEEQLSELNKVRNEDGWWAWREKTIPIVSAIYGAKSTEYELFANIGNFVSNFNDNTATSRNFLTGCIKAINIHNGKKNTSSKNPSGKSPVNVNIANHNNPNFQQSQNQTQTQQLNLNIKDILEDELPRARMKEINEIIESEEPQESKLQKVGEVLRKTGVEIIASTLAKVITTNMGLPS